MKRLSLTLALLLVTATFGFSQKLVVSKKDGTEIIGTKVSETDEVLVVNATNEAGIKDDMTISKDEIVDTRPWGPNDRDFEPIANLTPTPDLLPERSYREQIDGCKRYLETHKETATSKQLASVKKTLEILESELAQVREGGLKFDGRWIKKADRETNEYEIDMRIAIAQMREKLAAGDFRGAMQIYDGIERDFVHSERFEEARTLAQETLAAYKRQVAGRLKVVDARIDAREKSLLGLGADERAAEEAAIKRINERYEKLLLADQESKTRWLLLDDYHKAPMETVMRNITQAEANLSKPPSGSDKVVGPIYRDLWSALRGGDLDTAKTLYAELKSLKVPERYLARIDAQLNPPEPEPEPTPEPTPAPEPDGTPAPDAEPAPEDMPDESAETPKEAPEDAPKDTTATMPDSGEPDAASEDGASETAEKDEEKGFPTQLVLVIVLVLVITGALIAALGGKKK